MLPARVEPRGLISDVADNLLSALRGQLTPFGFSPVKKVALIVIDGLGTHNLLAHSGHARRLVAGLNQSGFSVHSGVPSTTSTALASLTTGQPPGTHGMLGYSVLEPHSQTILNHLKPFPAGVVPEHWQPCPTVFEILADEGIPSRAVGEARFDGTDFTRAILRGAEFSPSSRLDTHTAVMREFFDNHDTGLCYLYWPTLDRLGHSRGVGSADWVDELEAVDEWVGRLSAVLKPDEAAVLTADHGMVSVAESDRVVLLASDPLRADIAHFAGEPRCVHLYRRHGVDQAEFMNRVAAWVDGRGDVVSRDDAVARKIFGELDPAHLPRIGDVVVFAKDNWVFYDEATASVMSYQMVGQHGSTTEVETTVPLIPLGVWAP
jgi:predicted AlkP superfamily pyrophosphatase or phosphodiesterase